MSNVIQLKACPRCNGDMILEQHLGDSELVCFQCGYRKPTEQTTSASPRLLTARSRRAERKVA